MKKQHQDTNVTVETRTIAHLMVTTKQGILYINALTSKIRKTILQSQNRKTEKAEKRQMTPIHSKYVWEVKDK